MEIEDMIKNAAAFAQLQDRSEILTLGGAVLAGLLLLGAAGMAQSSVVHNAAHDARHALALPCH